MKSRKMKKSKNQPDTCAYIPEEVVTQILAKLPVKTLVRFRCVCKYWRSIIDDPDFVSMHRKLNNSTSSKLCSLEGLGDCGSSERLLIVRNANTFRKNYCVFKSSRRCYLLGRCDSLLLMRHSPNFYCEALRLINPSIRKSLLLPHCPIVSADDSVPDIIFGFARLSQDYKVIVIKFDRIPVLGVRQSRVAVYTLRDQQWTIRDNGLNINLLSFRHRIEPYYVCDGAAHWLWDEEYSVDNMRQNYILSLDFDTENFTFLELPRELDEMDSSRFLFVVGESLAILCVSPEITRIWILEKKSEKKDWTLLSDLNQSSNEGFTLFNQRMDTERVLYYEGDGGYLLYGRESYNIATGKVQLLGKSMSRRVRVEIEKYSESLVLCNGYETEDMKSSPFVLNK